MGSGSKHTIERVHLFFKNGQDQYMTAEMTLNLIATGKNISSEQLTLNAQWLVEKFAGIIEKADFRMIENGVITEGGGQ